MFLTSLHSKSMTGAEIEQRIGDVQESLIKQHVETICSFGPRSQDNPDAIRLATGYLRTTLEQYGYSVREEPLIRNPRRFNLIAERAGTTRKNKVMELGAHYDTVPRSPGADDNTSGVAGVLEAARILSTASCRRTIRFCLFDGEEENLLGSRSHVERFAEEADYSVAGIVVFELGALSGWRNRRETRL